MTLESIELIQKREVIRMSVQTDCEILSVQAMEAYARKYHVSGNSVVELFHENQVFEKIMIQHEYLHQISFEEVLEYVEKIIIQCVVKPLALAMGI